MSQNTLFPLLPSLIPPTNSTSTFNGKEHNHSFMKISRKLIYLVNLFIYKKNILLFVVVTFIMCWCVCVYVPGNIQNTLQYLPL